MYGHTESGAHKLKGIYNKTVAKLGECFYHYRYPVTSIEEIAKFILQFNPFKHVNDFFFDPYSNTANDQSIRHIMRNLLSNLLYDECTKHNIDPINLTYDQFQYIVQTVICNLLTKLERPLCDQYMKLFELLFDKDIKKKIKGLHVISNKNEYLSYNNTLSGWIKNIKQLLCFGEDQMISSSIIHPQNRKMPVRVQFFINTIDAYHKTECHLLTCLSMFFNNYCCILLEMKDGALLHLNLWKHHEYCDTYSRKIILKRGERYCRDNFTNFDNIYGNNNENINKTYKPYYIEYDGNIEDFVTKIQYYCDICQPLDINTYYASEGEE